MRKTKSHRSILPALLVVMALVFSGPAAFAGGDWNDSGIAWKSYEDGLAEAKKSGKPVCLIFYTEWCPHCTKYSGVFHKEEVIAKSKDFVMIRLDKDQNKELSGKYGPDGQYIPRTLFLSSKGEFQESIHAPREKYLYFLNPQAPGELLAAMDVALKKK